MEIFWIFACFSILGLIGYGFQVWSVRAKLNTQDTKMTSYEDETVVTAQLLNNSTIQPFSPPISILKPLKGLDDNLFDNLESLCIQDYPHYEIIFSLQDYNDPAYKVARKIKDKYPDKDITILVKRCNVGLNPKVNNLIPAYTIAKYENILVSDSNVMAAEDYLKESVKHMINPEVGLVSNLIQGIGGRTIGSIFENLHLNSFVMGGVCFLDRFLRMPCVVGKSMLMRKADLDAIGGFKAVKDVLAEDYIIGKKMHKSGKKVILSKHIIKNVNEYWGIRRFLNRHARWGRLRWKIGGLRYFSELLGNPVFLSCIPLFIREPTKTTVSFALSVASLKVIGDYYIGKMLKTEINSVFFFFSPIKDLIIGLIWFIPIISNTVIWRGNRYIIGKDSLLSPCPESGMLSWRYRFVDAIKARFA
jgi:ceramide glucosyltransferase